jgi:hypothetical protein
MAEYTREELMDIIRKSFEAKTRIDVGDFKGAKELLDDIIRKTFEKIKVVIEW